MMPIVPSFLFVYFVLTDFQLCRMNPVTKRHVSNKPLDAFFVNYTEVHVHILLSLC